MKLVLTLTTFACFHIILSAQNNFAIKGKISRLSKSKNVIISSSSGEFTGPVNMDGSFEINGTVEESGVALIKADSSGADAIWLEPGDYIIECKEITMDGIQGYLFRTPGLKGPKDAEIYHGFSQPRYNPKGTSREEIRQFYKNHFIGYIDSIFLTNPASQALPEMIRSCRENIGDEAAETYYSFLSSDQKNDSSTKQLEYYFKRKEKIEREKFLENFSMKTNKEKDFQLSSITDKKLILIDFWSSDCYPCRAKHKKLGELYEKYSSKGLEIVSVSLDDNKEEWLKAIQKDKMTWINVAELKGWDTSLALNYFVKSLPYALWLDGNRKIIGPELNEKEIDNYLNNTSSTIN